jgi:hypothetical protein
MALRSLTRAALVGTTLVTLASCAGGTPFSPTDPGTPPTPPGPTPIVPFLIGNTGIDRVRVVTVDAGGNVWVAGSFSGTVDFDPSASTTVGRTSLGGTDLFVARYAASGALVRVVTFGGTGDDEVNALHVDGSGNATIGGAVSSGYLCPGVPITTTVGGPTDLFVARLDAAGSCQWITVAGGASADAVRGLVVDVTGIVTITGDVSGLADFDATPSAGFPTQPYGGGASDLFLASYSSAGAFRYVITLGNAGDERGAALASDAAGAVYLSTNFTGTIDADGGTGTLQLTTTGASDVLLAKYTVSGAFVWADRLGGTDADEATRALAVIGTDVVVGLNVRGLADLDPGAGSATVASLGGSDIVIARYATATGALSGIPLRLGGTADDAITSLAAATGGQLAVAGRYSGTIDLDPGAGVTALQSSASGVIVESFHLVLTSTGTPVWAVSVGDGPSAGTTSPLSESVGLVPAPDGTFWSALNAYAGVDTDPASTSTLRLIPLGNGDGAVIRYSSAGALQR